MQAAPHQDGGQQWSQEQHAAQRPLRDGTAWGRAPGMECGGVGHGAWDRAEMWGTERGTERSMGWGWNGT